MKKYSINDLNETRLNIVCRVKNRVQFNKLCMICPNMVRNYEEGISYYLTSRVGSGFEYHYIGGFYKIIDFTDINFTEYSNGVPLIWEI